MVNPDFSDLRISAKKPAINESHFPFFILDDFVSADMYAQLLAEFPTHEEMGTAYQHGKVFVNNRQLEDENRKDTFFADKPAWRSLVNVLGSQAFAHDLECVLRPHLFKHRMLGALRKWRVDGAKMPPLDRSVQLTYEWSGMPSGAYINPHTDKAAKLATFVWHFPETGWTDEDEGATLFMSAKRAKHNWNWANFKLPFEELDLIERSDVKPNRLVMFAKTGNSWHAVPPIKCGKDVYRRVFIFNFRYPVEVANSLPARAFESFHRRSQGWLFDDFADVNRKPAN